MPDSNIAVNSLTARGGVGQIVWRWTALLGSCLPYLGIDKFEVWTAATNNRAGAVKAGEASDINFTQVGLTNPSTRYGWVRARDIRGNFGDFFPLSATAGVQGVTNETALDPLVTDYVARVRDEKLAREDADGALSQRLIGVEAKADDASAVGLLKFTARTGPTVPTGYNVSIALEGRISVEDALRRAGILIDLNALEGRLRLIGNKVTIEDDAGVVGLLFSNGKIRIGRLSVGILDATNLFVGGVVLNAAIANGAVGQTLSIFQTGQIEVAPSSTTGAIAQVPLVSRGGSNTIICGGVMSANRQGDRFGGVIIELLRDGQPLVPEVSQSGFFDDDQGKDFNAAFAYKDDVNMGTPAAPVSHTYSLRARRGSTPGWGGGQGSQNGYARNFFVIARNDSRG